MGNYQISQQRLLWPNQVAGCSKPLIKHPIIFLHQYSQHILGPLQVHWSLQLIEEIKTLIFEQDSEILMLDVTC